MKKIGIALGIALVAVAVGARAERRERRTDAWEKDFTIARERLATTGRNDYFILEPGWQIVMKDGREEVTITVLDETEEIDGVTTRVVEERETKGDRLVEVSRNFLAIDRETQDVYYFGEDVTKYRRDGRPYAAEDAWRAGVDGARPGLLMPGTIRIGHRYYQEVAPGVAMDRAENVSLDEAVETPAGAFEGCLKVIETTPLEPGERSIKLYARGIGMIGDGGLRLAKRPGTGAGSAGPEPARRPR